MYVSDKAEIVIDASPEEIWEYVTDPVHWTASNPEEHYGLEYDTPDNRPQEGATFHQAEEVAGMYADLHGRFQHAVARSLRPQRAPKARVGRRGSASAYS